MNRTIVQDEPAIQGALQQLLSQLEVWSAAAEPSSESWIHQDQHLAEMKERLQGWSRILNRFADRLQSVDQGLTDTQRQLERWVQHGEQLQQKWANRLEEIDKLISGKRDVPVSSEMTHE